MSFPFQLVLALFFGAMVGASMTTGKSGSAFYHFETSRHSATPRVAETYYRQIFPETGAKDSGQASKAVVARFAEELTQMKWTWDREIAWKAGSPKPLPPTALVTP